MDSAQALTIHPKVAAGGVSGAAALLVLAILTRYGITLTPALSSAVTLVVALVGAYLTRAVPKIDLSQFASVLLPSESKPAVVALTADVTHLVQTPEMAAKVGPTLSKLAAGEAMTGSPPA